MADLGSGSSDSSPAEVHRPIAEAVDTLVAEAAARRVRKDYAGCVAALIDALRITPDNASVALLLAGAYEERGMMDEALLWYQSAQKMAPDSVAADAGIKNILSSVRFGPAGARTPRRPANIRVWVASGAAVFVLLILAILIRGAQMNSRATLRNGLTTPPPPRAVRIPGVPQAPVQPSGPIRSSSRPSYGGTAVVSPQAPGQVRTAPETAIRAKLQETEGYWLPQIRIDDVVADPRYDAVTVTFSLPATVPGTKAVILPNSFYIAAAAFVAHSQVQVVTVRCAMPGQDGNYQLAFVGDIMRQTALGFSGGVTVAQMNASFTSTWWNPRISQ